MTRIKVPSIAPVCSIMGRRCVVPNCPSTDATSLSHRFPRKHEHALKWLNSLDLMHIPIEQLNRFVVCTKHFANSDYRNAQSKSLNFVAVPHGRSAEKDATDVEYDSHDNDGNVDHHLQQHAHDKQTALNEYANGRSEHRIEHHYPNANDDNNCDHPHANNEETMQVQHHQQQDSATTDRSPNVQPFDHNFEECIIYDSGENNGYIMDDGVIVFNSGSEAVVTNVKDDETTTTSGSNHLHECKVNAVLQTSQSSSSASELLQHHRSPDDNVQIDYTTMELDQYLTIANKCYQPTNGAQHDTHSSDEAFVYVMELNLSDDTNAALVPLANDANTNDHSISATNVVSDQSDQMVCTIKQPEITSSSDNSSIIASSLPSSLTIDNTDGRIQLQQQANIETTPDINAILSALTAQQLIHQQVSTNHDYNDDEPYALHDTAEVRLYNEMSKRSLIQLLVAANGRIRDLEQRLSTIESAHSKVLGSLELFRSVLQKR